MLDSSGDTFFVRIISEESTIELKLKACKIDTGAQCVFIVYSFLLFKAYAIQLHLFQS